MSLRLTPEGQLFKGNKVSFFNNMAKKVRNARGGSDHQRKDGSRRDDEGQEASVDVLRHRIILTYEAEAQAVTTDAIIKKVFNAVPVP